VFQYDDAGRLVASGDTTFEYDGALLTRIERAADRVTTFEYDAGNVIRKIDMDGNETRVMHFSYCD
jgi:YD repeat-containing protein